MEKLIITLFVVCMVALGGATVAAYVTGTIRDATQQVGLERLHRCPPQDRSPGCPLHGVP